MQLSVDPVSSGSWPDLPVASASQVLDEFGRQLDHASASDLSLLLVTVARLRHITRYR